MRKTLLSLLAIFLAAAPAAAQDSVSLTVTTPPGKIRLADSFKFTVEASLPEAYSLMPDTASADGSGFELLSFAKTGETRKDGRKTENFEIKAQAFTLGISTFPAISWSIGGAPEGSTAATAPFTLEVLPLFKTREGEGIRDIYPPFRYLPWPWLLALSLAVAAAIFAYRMRAHGAAAGIQKFAWLDPRSPYQRASDRLEKLGKSPLAAAGKLKEFYTGLASVLRLYLAEEFSIDASLMTTPVLGRELKRTGADIKTALRARELLQKSDLVKFARLKPEDAEADSRVLEELLAEFHRAAETARAQAAAAAAAQKQTGRRP